MVHPNFSAHPFTDRARSPESPSGQRSVIVRGKNLQTAIRAVDNVGGDITSKIGLIDAVVATVSLGNLVKLQNAPGILSVTENRRIESSGKKSLTSKPVTNLDWPKRILPMGGKCLIATAIGSLTIEHLQFSRAFFAKP